MTGYRPGDRVTSTLDDTTGTTVTATLAVLRVDQIGCGCQRLVCDRPGPDVGPSTCRTVHLLTGCGRHATTIHAPTSPPGKRD